MIHYRSTLPRCALAALAALSGASLPPPASAAIITVGETGANCDVATLEDAFAQAAANGVRDEIRLTRDVAGGVWHANLSVQDRDFDLVGGFAACDAAGPDGRTAISGVADVEAPVLTLRADGSDVGLVHLDITDGSAGEKNDGAGIEYVGNGLLTLEDVSLARNRSPLVATMRAAVAVTSAGGAATLRFKDRVSVSDNLVSGIRLFGEVRFESLGRDVEVSRNEGFGLLVNSPASFDLGGNGRMFAGNTTWGIVVMSMVGAESVSGTSRLYSIDPADPLRIHNNGLGAILMLGNSAGRNPHHLCTKNVSVTGHEAANGMGGRGLLDVDGASVELSMDAGCEFPPEADIECDAVTCRLVGDNRRAAGGSLAFVHNGARIAIDRAAFLGNSATSIAIANAGEPASASSLYLSSSLVADNSLDTQVLGAYNGASVHAIGLTLADNTGTFARNLFAADAGVLDVRDSIVDQPQPLLSVEGDPATTTLTRLLARNADGARAGDSVMLGQPIYAPGSYRQTPDSPGIDRAPSVGGRDVGDGQRDVDTAEIPDGDGPRDLGAYELQARSLDYLFADGFEERVRAGSGEREVMQ